MENGRNAQRGKILPIIIVFSSIMLFAADSYNFLLFHTLVEVFTVVVSFGIFLVTWSSRRYSDNVFLIVIGIGYFFTGVLDLTHLLSYEGLNVISGYGADLPTQLWIAARYLEVFSFLTAFFLIGRMKNEEFMVRGIYLVFVAYAAIFSMIILSIFYLEIFPQSYMEGVGMTLFKIYSEYLISFLLVVTAMLLFRRRQRLDRQIVNLLSLSLVMKFFSEIMFTQYIGISDFSNVLGHIFRFISFLLMYKAVFEVGMDKPYEFLFLNMKKSEERYRSLVEFSPDPIVVHRKGRVIYANGLAKELFGSESDEDLIGAELVGFFHPKYRNQIKERIGKIFSGEWKDTPRTEMEVMRPDGRNIPVEVKGIKISYEGKDAVESIIRDISERKEAEKKIRSLAQFPEENPNPVIRAFSDGKVQYANRPAKEMMSHFGWAEGDIVPDIYLSAIKKVLDVGNGTSTETVCPYGHVFHMEFVPSFTDGHVNIYGRNITDRKIAEKKLAEAQAELQRRTEERLNESYQYMGIINRRISLLLELEENFKSKKGKQEMIDYVLNSALNLSRARVGAIYASSGPNHFSLLSSTGLEKDKIGKMQMLSVNSVSFIAKLIKDRRRVNGPCRLNESECFKGILEMSYFIALPILKNNHCSGFMFLGFTDRESMDPQELEFLDVFMKHVSSAFSDFKILE